MVEPLPDRPVLTVKEAAAAIGVNVKTLYDDINAGRFPALRVGRVIRCISESMGVFLV